jgi:MFS family permease
LVNLKEVKILLSSPHSNLMKSLALLKRRMRHIRQSRSKTVKKFRDWALYLSIYIGAAAYGAIYLLTLFTQKMGGDESDVGIFLGIAGITTLLFVGSSGSLAKRFGAHVVCASGILLLSLGLAILVVNKEVSPLYYAIGVLAGAGWSLFYAAGPMLVLGDVSDLEKGRYVNAISVCIVVGTATLPIISDLILPSINAISLIFTLAAFIFGPVSAVLILLAGRLFNCKPQLVKGGHRHVTKRALFQILRTEARYPLIMVFLGACIFSSMMNFQTSYAAERGFNYAIFYFTYMASVIGCRIAFGSLLVSKNPIAPTPMLLSLMAVGLLTMILNSQSQFIYAVGACFLGVSYGLVYPLIKTYALRNTVKELQHEVVAYFGLFYFAGVYLFPLIGASIIKLGSYNSFLMVLLLICLIDLVIGYRRRGVSIAYQFRTDLDTAVLHRKD